MLKWYGIRIETVEFDKIINEEVNVIKTTSRRTSSREEVERKFEDIVHRYVRTGDYTITKKAEKEVTFISDREDCVASDYEDYPYTITTISIEEEES